MDVKMSYAALEATSGKVDQAKADLDQVISFLDSAVSALEGEWLGESHSAFVNAWNESKPTMQKLSEAVGNFAPALNRAVNAQREREAETGQVMGELVF